MPAKCPIKSKAKAEGKQYYYTGKPCVNGHICERRVHRSVCLLCEKERKDNFWSKFDDPSKALSDWKKEYYSKNPSKLEQLKSKNLARYHSDVEFKKRHNEINRKNWSIRRFVVSIVKHLPCVTEVTRLCTNLLGVLQLL